MSDRAIKIKDASFGFSAYLWRVSKGTEVHFVHATDNYTAAEACGWTFSTCCVQEMQLVPVAKG